MTSSAAHSVSCRGPRWMLCRGWRWGLIGACCLLLAGCGSSAGGSATPGPVAPAITMVTVPRLAASGQGLPDVSVAGGGVIPGATDTTEAPPVDGALTTPMTAVSATDDPPIPPTGAPPTLPTAGAPQAVSSAAPIAPHQPATSEGPTGTAAPATVAVDLAKCAGCEVIGAAADVQPGLAAVLATAPQGAVLLATRADGGVVGVTNVPYGVAFPAPAGGVLPCDGSGRCFVAARQGGGTAVISVFRLSASGQWRDVTSAGGFSSATSAAAVYDADGDGTLDIAIQSDSGSAVRWIVFHWSGDRFVVLGCAPDSAQNPVVAALSLATCSG